MSEGRVLEARPQKMRKEKSGLKHVAEGSKGKDCGGGVGSWT
jgi:hypothetical protein